MFQAKKKLERIGISRRRINRCLDQLESQPIVVAKKIKFHGSRYFQRLVYTQSSSMTNKKILITY